jgi:hypothetical protein
MGNQAILWHFYSAANNGGFGVTLTLPTFHNCYINEAAIGNRFAESLEQVH